MNPAFIFNEADGGGTKFEHNDGTWSGLAVNDGGANGIAAQIYAIDSTNTAVGTKLNIEKGKITYIKNKATAARTAADELVVKGDLKNIIDATNDASLAPTSDNTTGIMIYVIANESDNITEYNGYLYLLV